ncbi:MAG: formate/nitrite transporter family protein [Clostridiales bacterium]|nr:formate/nitrite transporter family protein [Clostridiales bacterium]
MLKTLTNAILAGICIGLGGTVCLSVDNSVIGAFLFSIGLLTILSFSLNLYTGKVGYVLENKPAYLGTLGIIWLGNLVGTGVFALLLRFTRVYPAISEKASGMVETKLSDTPISILLLAVGCGLCMYIAVQSYKTQTDVLKCLLVVMPVMVFILAKFEHCIANMFYFWLSGSFTIKTLAYLLLMTLGNSLGSLIIPTANKLTEKRNS